MEKAQFPETLLAWVANETNVKEKDIGIEQLSGGSLNFVWRLKLHHSTLVIKYSPPYVASNPTSEFERRYISSSQCLQSRLTRTGLNLSLNV